jgi:phospholipase/carboxylesterase
MLNHHLREPRDGATHHCLVLHGLGDSHRGWMDVAPMLALPELGFAFADAPIPYGPGFSWFDIHPDWSVDDDQVRASRRQLGELIEHLLARLGIGEDRLFLMGFSQGCLMALDTALRWPRRFAGVVGISGFLTLLDEYPSDLGAAARQQRILMTHGIHDGMIPIGFVRRQKDRLLGLGIQVEWKEYEKEHTLDPTEELEDIRRFFVDAMLRGPRRARGT